MTRPVGRGIETSAVRAATRDDVDAISALMAQYSAMGNVLPRTREDILRNVGDFYVVEMQSGIIGCGALEVFTSELVEIRSLMIENSHARQGHGGRLVEHLTAVARARGFRRLFALTYVPGFFHRHGFETVSKDALPEKVWGICVRCYKYNRCDEIAVQRRL